MQSVKPDTSKCPRGEPCQCALITHAKPVVQLQSTYPIKDIDKIMEEVNLNDNVKYMNYYNKISDGVVTRILRPDIIFIKDCKTNYEEKIVKMNILLNLTLFESQIMDKLTEKYKFFNNLSTIESISDNIVSLIDIIDFIKNDVNVIKNYLDEENNKLKDEINKLNNEITQIYLTIYNISGVCLFLIIFLYICTNNNFNVIINNYKNISDILYNNYIKYIT